MENQVKQPKSRLKSLITKVLLGVLLVVTLVSIPMVGINVRAGEYTVVQTLSGDLKVYDTPGIKFTGLRTGASTYREGDTLYFSESDLDGGSGIEADAVSVIFRDGAKGMVNGNIQYRLPASEEGRLELHKLFGRNYKVIVHDLIRKSVAEAILQSATYYKGEEAYSYGRSEFVSLIQKQLEQGIYATEKEVKVIKDAEGNDFIDNIVKPKLDKDGNPIVYKKSKFETFGVTIVGFNVEKINLDENTMAYISKKKDAEFQKIQQQAEAEQAKQQAITAEAKGRAAIAEAKATAEVTKQKAVTEAEQTKAVAILNAEKDKAVAELAKVKAGLEADAILLRKEADAKANQLLVTAGLTPLEKATLDKETAIGVAEALAKANVPQIYIDGGASAEGGTNPFTALGINALLDVMNKMKK